MVDIKQTHLPSDRENKLTMLYKSTFPVVARFVSKRGGSFDQAKDIFHDALIAWYEKSAGSGFSASVSDEAYIFGIARFLWYRNFAAEQKTDSPAPGNEPFEDPGFGDGERISSARLLTLIETAGKKCLEILKSFYYDKLPLAGLAEGMGFRSLHSASVQKYKCLEKVRETVKEKSLHYEDFLE